MGLDIVAYSGLRALSPSEIKWEDNYPTNGIVFYLSEHFQDQYMGLDEDAVYAENNSFSFRAGSYSGYNNWRGKLEEFAEEHLFGGEFDELINFSDCDGTIGPFVSAKLHNDFKVNLAKAEEFSNTLDGDWKEYFMEKYHDWMKAFEMASDNGAVMFC